MVIFDSSPSARGRKAEAGFSRQSRQATGLRIGHLLEVEPHRAREDGASWSCRFVGARPSAFAAITVANQIRICALDRGISDRQSACAWMLPKLTEENKLHHDRNAQIAHRREHFITHPRSRPALAARRCVSRTLRKNSRRSNQIGGNQLELESAFQS